MSTNEDWLVPDDEFIAAQKIGAGNFAGIGEGFIKGFVAAGYIGRDDVVVDIGCGLGRLARPLTNYLSKTGHYYGFDVNKDSIDWCSTQYEQYANFEFKWVNARSIFYNPIGTEDAGSYRFPLNSDSVDFTFLTSVFTHMKIDDVDGYLREISRFLRPGKFCYSTYFLVTGDIEESFQQVADKGIWTRVKGGYVRDPKKPEAVVALKEESVRDLYNSAGFDVIQTVYGNYFDHFRGKEHGGKQDTIIARKRVS